MERLNFNNLTELKRAVTASGSKFFDKDTMRWFGTRNLRLFGGDVVVGTDSNAPEGYPCHWVRRFVHHAEGDFIRADTLARCATREEAEELAREYGTLSK